MIPFVVVLDEQHAALTFSLLKLDYVGLYS